MSEYRIMRRWADYYWVVAFLLLLMCMQIYSSTDSVQFIIAVSIMALFGVGAIIGAIYLSKRNPLGIILGSKIKIYNLFGVDLVVNIPSLKGVYEEQDKLVFEYKDDSLIKLKKSAFRKSDILKIIEVVSLTNRSN